MKAWLCLSPVLMKLGDILLSTELECLGVLAVYRTKKQGRIVHGSKAQFVELDWRKDK